MGSLRFWIPALLWLPAGIIAGEVLRTGSAQGMMTPSPLVELTLVAPCGLPLALACRRLGRSGHSGPTLVAWSVLGAAAVASLLGTLPAGAQALLASLPVWVVAWRLARRPPRLEHAPSFVWRERGRFPRPGGLLLLALSSPEALPRRNRFGRTS